MRRAEPKRAVLVAAGVLVIAATAACGERGAPGSPGLTTSQHTADSTVEVTRGEPPGSATSTKLPSPGASATKLPCSIRQPCAKGPLVPESQLDATDWPAKDAPKVWTESGGRTVAIPVTHGVCEKLRGERASASATEVRVVVVRTDTSNGHPCTMQAVLDTVRVSLKHPLGDRTLVLDHREQR